ncbi:AGE family epimerase/isomerase [Gluconobacter sp. Dm-62]|uniref:AGE family epimerase/isomerase n=1 Tax=Gluconobacter sp. Dm-62 TaxID=2799804 RepID=UPI001B8D53AB|nr:AGE family epimerase/isomerase [Gluconobacter sp. Dm-62]MBS1103277.1 AGE family epimerase/isomerase [Gluconobacter sp. Dm-62]
MQIGTRHAPLPTIMDADQKALWSGWLTRTVLPEWSGVGFDRGRRLYHERLTLSGEPLVLPASRLMVQARQISTFCRAALDGLHDASTQALMCVEEVERLYRHRDGQAGWIFSVAPDGSPVGTKRDLYAHAFILYAYGWAYRLSGNPHFLSVARQTVLELHEIFRAEHGGFLDEVPLTGQVRHQNPHMHLLEAFLVLFEVSGDSFYLDEATALVRLALDRLIQSGSGALLEDFVTDWRPSAPSGENRVEPGHLFEWSWLFGDYLRLNTAAKNAGVIGQAAEGLFAFGMRYGVMGSVVRDAILDDGRVLENATRIWPQTELCRLLICRNERPDILRGLSDHFFETFIPDQGSALWVDRFDASGKAAVSDVPASSLYHIYGAAREFC